MAMITTEMIPQLSINKLIKAQYIIEGGTSEGTFAAEEGDPLVHLYSNLTGSDRILNIKYQIEDTHEWMDYDIAIEAVGSNLGKEKGMNFYFISPLSGKRAKILYLCFKTHRFVHRDDYPQRIYYPTEAYWKMDRVFAKSVDNENKLLKSFMQMKKETYNGENTRISKRIQKLTDRKLTLDCLISQWRIKQINTEVIY